MAKLSPTNVRTGKVRLSYANLLQPKEGMNGGEAKYSVSILIPKTDAKTVKEVQDAIEAAKKDGVSKKWGGKLPGRLMLPLRDGDTERGDDPVYAGHYFLNASAKKQPQIVRPSGQAGVFLPALEDEYVYSGVYAYVVVNFFAYDSNGNRGVGAGLGPILFAEHGDRLGGGVSAQAAFGDIEADDIPI